MPKNAPPRNAARRILFPLGEKEHQSTGGRVLKLAGALADAGHRVDILTCHDGLAQAATESYHGRPEVRVRLTKADERFWTMAQRDNFAKTFIKLTHDIVIPGTDMKLWKMVGFDDFLWNVSASVFPKITESYDLMVFPIPSFHEHPSPIQDVFYTNVMFYAKEHRVPVAGLLLYPTSDVPPIFPKLLDYYIVKDERERGALTADGASADRVFVLEDLKERYCIDTIEDVYMQHTFDKEIAVPADHLGIVIVNHVRNRQQLLEVFAVIGKLGVPTTVFFVFLNFAVKELHEKDIFDDLLKPTLDKTIGAYYSVDSAGMIRALMLSDAMVATQPMLQLSFGARYRKTGIVYNPLARAVGSGDDVGFAGSPDALRRMLLEAYERKQRRMTLSNIVTRVPE
ncbi:MAG: hypothetical protein ACOYXR_00855 [Nitrospirota bacterium]